MTLPFSETFWLVVCGLFVYGLASFALVCIINRFFQAAANRLSNRLIKSTLGTCVYVLGLIFLLTAGLTICLFISAATDPIES